MEKKPQKSKPTTSPLSLRKETLRQLKKSELQQAPGGTRIRIPISLADDTSPIYGYEEAP